MSDSRSIVVANFLGWAVVAPAEVVEQAQAVLVAAALGLRAGPRVLGEGDVDVADAGDLVEHLAAQDAAGGRLA